MTYATENSPRDADLVLDALDALNDLVYVFTPDGEFRYWNDRVPAVTGYSEAQLRNMEPADFFEGEDAARVERAVARVLDADETVTVEADLVCADDESLPVEFSARRFRDANGRVAGFVGIGREIRERRRRRRELQRHHERLEEFAGLVSHDLRNPLQVASANLELLATETDSDRVERVQAALQRMEHLLEDMLALANGGADLQPEAYSAVDLRAQVTDAWDRLDPDGAVLRLGDDLGRVLADAGRLSQLLENLLDNATTHGGSEVTVGSLDGRRVDGDDSGTDDRTGFYVVDDGQGIPADERDRVFDSGYSTADAGTGFGLAIVRSIADAHGWTVSVTDAADGGARFEVTGLERP